MSYPHSLVSLIFGFGGFELSQHLTANHGLQIFPWSQIWEFWMYCAEIVLLGDMLGPDAVSSFKPIGYS